MSDKEFEWMEPYSIRFNRGRKYFAYSILFEDHLLFSSDDYDLVHKMTGLLNGAYNLGRAKKAAKKLLAKINQKSSGS